jgi:hypothetical protein
MTEKAYRVTAQGRQTIRRDVLALITEHYPGIDPTEVLAAANFVNVPDDIAVAFKVMHTVRRSDGENIGGDFSHMVTAGPSDWEAAHADAMDACEPIEYVMDTWVRVKSETRTIGGGPSDDDG